MSHLGAKLRVMPLVRQGPAATLEQHCPGMTQRPGICIKYSSMTNVHILSITYQKITLLTLLHIFFQGG